MGGWNRNSEQDMWRYVDVQGEQDCWPWKGYVEPSGYGRFRVAMKRWRVHRLAFKLIFGSVSALIRHTCHNRLCCNPKHLLPGTNQDNSNDMVHAGRSCTAEKHPKAKLTKETAARIKELYKPGEVTQRELANKFGVCQRTVCKVVNGIGGFG